ncbi:MAG: hypothetical protein DMG03_05500 [Acidobacteria bacterium]|nr:MAG: hypothetical protein DMG03_05500 [Acidobacteriota bacterium]
MSSIRAASPDISGWRRSFAVALPEGVAAMMAQSLGGPGYVCWAHGEDLASALTSRELTWLTKVVYRRSTAALANSRNTAGMLTALGVPETKIHIVHPAVDADRFHPRVDGSAVRRRYAADASDVLLLSVGRLQRRKGHDVAIQAVAALRSRCPNVRYVIGACPLRRNRGRCGVAGVLRRVRRVRLAEPCGPRRYRGLRNCLPRSGGEWQTCDRGRFGRRARSRRARRHRAARRRRQRRGGRRRDRRARDVG